MFYVVLWCFLFVLFFLANATSQHTLPAAVAVHHHTSATWQRQRCWHQLIKSLAASASAQGMSLSAGIT